MPIYKKLKNQVHEQRQAKLTVMDCNKCNNISMSKILWEHIWVSDYFSSISQKRFHRNDIWARQRMSCILPDMSFQGFPKVKYITMWNELLQEVVNFLSLKLIDHKLYKAHMVGSKSSVLGCLADIPWFSKFILPWEGKLLNSELE